MTFWCKVLLRSDERFVSESIGGYCLTMASKKPSKAKKLIKKFFKNQNNEAVKLTFDPYEDKLPPVVEETTNYLLLNGKILSASTKMKA